MQKIAIWIIAICAVCHTVDVYKTEDGGINVFVGNFGYHIAGESE